jgi:hypothetical protein
VINAGLHVRGSDAVEWSGGCGDSYRGAGMRDWTSGVSNNSCSMKSVSSAHHSKENVSPREGFSKNALSFPAGHHHPD